jgi:hypothetical protein
VTDEAALDDLRWHWGDAYLIDMFGSRWVAQRRDSRATLSAASSADLLEKIRADYASHPVGRQVAGADRPLPPDRRFLPEG